MSKAINFSVSLKSALASIKAGNDDATVAKHVFTGLVDSGATGTDLFSQWLQSDAQLRAVHLTRRGIAAGHAAVLKSQGVDVSDNKAVIPYIKQGVFAAAGYAAPLKKSDDESAEAKSARVNLGQSAYRLAKLIAEMNGAPVRQTVETPAPRAALAAIKALRADGMTKAQVLAAVKKAFA